MESSFVTKISLLNQTSLDSMRLPSERSIVKRFVEVGMSVLGADYGFSFIKERGRRRFILAYKHRDTPYQPSLPRSIGVTAHAFKARRPQYFVDVQQNDFLREDARQSMKSVVVIPISYRTTKYGTLDLCFNERHEFTDEEKTLCEVIGRNAANALTIHRLLKDQKDALIAREQFLALVSHELKTPITSMKLYAQHLLQMANKNYTAGREKEVEGLELINRQIVRLTKLVNDILLFGRSKSGPIQLHIEPIDMVQLIKNMIKQLTIIAEKRTMSFDHEGEMIILGDKNKLEQVLVNLISNAIKYSPDGSSIDIFASNKDGKFLLSIKDQGVGIPEDKQKKVFKQYVQAAPNQASGFGLGLYISKMIVDAHHGEMWVESEVDKGSTFYVALPLPVIE